MDLSFCKKCQPRPANMKVRIGQKYIYFYQACLHVSILRDIAISLKIVRDLRRTSEILQDDTFFSFRELAISWVLQYLPRTSDSMYP